MKYIRPQEIIHSKEFLREPVQDTYKDIEKLETSKIILRGEGTGRSTLLNYMEEKKANTEQPFMLLNFSGDNLPSDTKKCFSNELFREFLEHYWEIHFTRKILWYIKKYHELTYHSEFLQYGVEVQNCCHEIDNLLNSLVFTDSYCLPKLYTSKEISGEILDKFKKLMHIESIVLGSNRFDSINNSDELSQKILYSYFDLFDKTIIEADDKSLPEEWYKTYFREDSELITFTPYTIEYNQYLEIIYNIIEKRINEYNFSLYEKSKNNNQFYKPFSLDWLDDDTLKLLKNKANGNIRIILDIVNELTLQYNLNDEITQRHIERIIQDKIEFEFSRKLEFRQPKLYL